MAMEPVRQWLRESDEPWTRYRTRLDLDGRPPDDPVVQADRAAMLAHPDIRQLMDAVAAWPGYALKRHSDAGHPLYVYSTLADFGLTVTDPGLTEPVERILAHQSSAGSFETLLHIPLAFGGPGEDRWAWMACDAPVLLYSLVALGLADEPAVQRAADHLTDLVNHNGWPCVAASELGRFRGPGRRGDPCPLATVQALKAMAHLPTLRTSTAARKGVAMLLWHWEHQAECKFYLFGIGSDFRKLKYPFIWYNLLHVVDVLSHFPFVHHDPRFQEMLAAVLEQADEQGRYTAGSMYRAWQGWSFANKQIPSPWLTFLVARIRARVKANGSVDTGSAGPLAGD